MGRRKVEALSGSLGSGGVWKSIFKMTIALIWFWPKFILTFLFMVTEGVRFSCLSNWGVS